MDTPPDGNGWVHEAKLDGYRMQMHVQNGHVRFFSRRGLDWSARFPEIVDAGKGLRSCILDGEVCAVGSDSLPSFAGLTDALRTKNTKALVYYAFDMMFDEGRRLLNEPLLIRKKLLKKAIGALPKTQKKHFSFVQHASGDGAAMHKAACDIKLEGIVSKRIDAAYAPGDRSGLWTKAKCRPSQELVVAGWKTTGQAFRSLIVGAYVRNKFTHVGTVGTGYNSRNLPALIAALKARATHTSPLDIVRDPKAVRGAHWVRPTLVIEAEIASWTSDGLVRQASFKGMREDKSAKKVVVEMADNSRRMGS